MKTTIAFLTLLSLLHAQVTEIPLPEQEFNFDEVAILEPITLETPAPLSIPTEPFVETPKKYPLLAATLSSLLPGLGHMYIGDYQTASGLLTTTFGEISLATIPSDSVRVNTFITLQNTWSYGIYAAYRDARILNGQLGYQYKMPTDSLYDLTTAPFRPSVLKKAEVWGGLLGSLAIATTITYFAFPEDSYGTEMAMSSEPHVSPLAAFPVGIGEEALFRGYLQSQLIEWFHPAAGIALSSLAFGAMHIPNAQALSPEHQWRYYSVSLPIITSLGAYFGWLTYKNHSLKESVAIHSWYDFTLFAVSALAPKASITKNPSFAFSFSF